ncbi:mannitol dehydrogenase family protein [Actinotalea sp.]|uniref:mannitol dehydrogenase family protein n=1 Tax=Actinotalea sp. TaxID=1872145 RepID=UPI0035632F62
MRELARTTPAPPVRHVHLGLGNFFRAHQAWFTTHAPEADDWGIAAFTGRSDEHSDALAVALNEQDGLYTLVTRNADGDHHEVVSSVVKVHSAADHAAWLAYFADPQVHVLTTTVTEAGYVRGPDGGLDVERPEIVADLAALRADLTSPVATAPAKIVAGLAARKAAGAGALTVVPCDNLPSNGAAIERVVTDFAALLDPELAAWIADTVSFVTTMVDRITPRPTAEDIEGAQRATGVNDRAVVVTEPFYEWVICGTFVADRPRWEDAGATFTDDVDPFEDRKLWLLNGAHSILAYAGSIRGHVTVADAMRDETCRTWLQEWWSTAIPYLPQPAGDNAAYAAALVERFANPQIHHRLDQIAADGSQKLPIRILPTLRREIAAGRMPAGATRPLAAWVCHLRGNGAAVTDGRAETFVPLAVGPLREAVHAVLTELDPELAANDALVDAVTAQAGELDRN